MYEVLPEVRCHFQASEKIIPESRYKDKKREELLDWLKEMI